MRNFKYRIEAALLAFLMSGFRLLPLDVASAIGGAMARAVGPFLPVHKVAMRNLALALPDMQAAQRRRVLMGMWDNLGRNAAELPRLPGNALTNRVDASGLEHLPKPNDAVIFISGHLGNWELTYPMAFDQGVPLTLVYRHVNNPFIDRMLAALRASHSSNMLPKGPRGAVKLGRALKNGETLAMLVDQKMNDGIAVPFFGRDAMTAPAVAQIALRYDMPIIPARIIRTGGAHFKGIIYPPLAFEKTGDPEKDTRAIMTAINATLESWIREYPEQWFWVHKRWP